MPKKVYFLGDYVVDDVTGLPQNFHLYSCLGEVGSANKLQGQCLVNKRKYHDCLCGLYMPKDAPNEHFRDCRSKVNITGLLSDLITRDSEVIMFSPCVFAACVTLSRQLHTRFIPCESSDQCTSMCSDFIVIFAVITHMHVSVRKHVNSNIPKCHS